MSKVPMGGAGGLIDQLIIRMGYAPSSIATDPQRKDCLQALNDAEKYLSQGPLGALYLSMRTPLSLSNGAVSVALPINPAIDFGKDLVLELPSGLETLTWKPADQLPAAAAPSYDCITSGAPSYFTVALDSDGVTMKFFFKPSNTTGSPISYTLCCQRAVLPLTDDSSTSFLPEGYESTLLIDRAEAVMRRLDDRLGADALDAKVDARIQEFNLSFRANKQQATTDEGQQARKVEDEQLAPGK